MSLPTGKLPLDLLDELLAPVRAASDPRVLVGPEPGEDAAIIDFGDTCLVAKTDPITFATDEIGYYAVHVCANDIATMGAEPRWFLPALLLPEGRTTPGIVRSVFESIRIAAGAIGVTVCGGHTEITAGLDRPIVVGQMLGEISRHDIVRSSGLRPGDCLLLSKGLAVEATALLAREKRAALLEAGVPPAVVERAAAYLHAPGISVLKEARIACATARVHAMHDPTEGGVATALRELATASRVGLTVNAAVLFASDDTRAVCGALGIDILGAVSSGALLIGLDPADGERVRDAIRAGGIACDVIARVGPPSHGLRLVDGATSRDLPAFARDEVARLFSP